MGFPNNRGAALAVSYGGQKYFGGSMLGYPYLWNNNFWSRGTDAPSAPQHLPVPREVWSPFAMSPVVCRERGSFQRLG